MPDEPRFFVLEANNKEAFAAGLNINVSNGAELVSTHVNILNGVRIYAAVFKGAEATTGK